MIASRVSRKSLTQRLVSSEYERSTGSVSGTFNPLVAGSNPARPTKELVVNIEGVMSDDGAFLFFGISNIYPVTLPFSLSMLAAGSPVESDESRTESSPP